MSEKLSVKISYTLMIIITVSLALNSALNMLNFEKTYVNFERQRYEVYGQGVKEIVDNMLALGLTVPEMAALREKLKDFIAKNPDVVSVRILDAKNICRFSAAREDCPEFSQDFRLLPPGLSEKALGDLLATYSYRAVVKNFTDSFGETGGRLILLYGRKDAASAFAEMKRFLIFNLAAIMAVASVLGFLCIHLITARTSRKIRAMTEALETGATSDFDPADPMLADFAAFREASAAALKRLSPPDAGQSSEQT